MVPGFWTQVNRRPRALPVISLRVSTSPPLAERRSLRNLLKPDAWELSNIIRNVVRKE